MSVRQQRQSSTKDTYRKYRKREKQRRDAMVRSLIAPLPVAFAGHLANGKSLGKRARHIDGNFVVKRLCTDNNELAALCVMRQHLLKEVLFCEDTLQRSEPARLLSGTAAAPGTGEQVLLLRSHVTARTLAQWLTPKVSHELLYHGATQKFACQVFQSVFVRYIAGLNDNDGRAVAKHILIAQRPRRIVQISLDGAEDTRDAVNDYADNTLPVMELLRASHWPREVRDAFRRLCNEPECRARMLRYLNDLCERSVWQRGYDLVERYGLFSKVSVLSMQARLFQLRTALQQNHIG